jgi:hypothetical protein
MAGTVPSIYPQTEALASDMIPQDCYSSARNIFPSSWYGFYTSLDFNSDYDNGMALL